MFPPHSRQSITREDQAGENLNILRLGWYIGSFLIKLLRHEIISLLAYILPSQMKHILHYDILIHAVIWIIVAFYLSIELQYTLFVVWQILISIQIFQEILNVLTYQNCNHPPPTSCGAYSWDRARVEAIIMKRSEARNLIIIHY